MSILKTILLLRIEPYRVSFIRHSSKITVHLNNNHSQLIIILIYIFIYILFITPIDRKFMSKFVPKIKLIFRSKTIVCLKTKKPSGMFWFTFHSAFKVIMIFFKIVVLVIRFPQGYRINLSLFLLGPILYKLQRLLKIPE